MNAAKIINIAINAKASKKSDPSLSIQAKNTQAAIYPPNKPPIIPIKLLILVSIRI